MAIDPWALFDHAILGIGYEPKVSAIKALDKKLSEEAILCLSGFMGVAAQLAAGNIGRYKIGETVTLTLTNGQELPFIIIGKNADGDNTITVQSEKAFGRVRFCSELPGHPYGWSHPLHNDIRRWLRQFEGNIPEEDLDCVEIVKKNTRLSDEDGGDTIQTEEKFFLLSASEAGFRIDNEYVYDEGKAYEYFARNQNRSRRKVDLDGDPRYWWLRSPDPSHAHGVRLVHTDGSLGNSSANSSRAVAPACVIKAKAVLSPVKKRKS